METVDKRIDRVMKQTKSGDKKAITELEALKAIKVNLENGKPARETTLTDEQQELLKDLFLLSSKPMLYIANVNEDQLSTINTDENVLKVKEYAASENTFCIPLCAKLEEELSELDDESKMLLMQDYGLNHSGLDELTVKGYDLLGLMSYLTAGKQEVRAWTIKKGTKAPQAAGKIHTDFERGFIKAEIVSYDDLINSGSMTVAKEKGLVRLEGKDYVVQDGDIILFRFNV